jgi:hypothetical protein
MVNELPNTLETLDLPLSKKRREALYILSDYVDSRLEGVRQRADAEIDAALRSESHAESTARLFQDEYGTLSTELENIGRLVVTFCDDCASTTAVGRLEALSDALTSLRRLSLYLDAPAHSRDDDRYQRMRESLEGTLDDLETF